MHKLDIDLTNKFLIDLIKFEAERMIEDLNANQMSVVLVPAPEQRHSGHMVRVVESRPPEWYMDLYQIKGRKTFKRHRFMDALGRIKKGIFKLAWPYDVIALEYIQDNLLKKEKPTWAIR